MKMRAIAQTAARWIASRRRRSYLVGKYQITLPPGHKLDEYQKAFLNYDRKLPVIAALVDAKYPGAVIMDIGANIGDSAVAIRSVVGGPIVCVEGNSAFLPYLHANLKLLQGINRVIPSFIRSVGTDLGFEIRTTNGTAHLAHSNAPKLRKNSAHTVTVREMLAKNVDLGPVKLFKTDTDGSDFSILLGSLDCLAIDKPVLFFEFDPLIGNSTPLDAIAAVESLAKIGYRSVVIYDNYGNYLISAELTPELAKDLVANVVQRRAAGGGAVYFDLCCFSDVDSDIFCELVRHERTNGMK
jgi:FkbM family methyltransferase